MTFWVKVEENLKSCITVVLSSFQYIGITQLLSEMHSPECPSICILSSSNVLMTYRSQHT